MTRRRQHQRVTKRPWIDRSAIEFVAQIKGCTCRPDVRHGDPDRHGISRIHVAHDAACPAATATSQLLIVPRPSRSRR